MTNEFLSTLTNSTAVVIAALITVLGMLLTASRARIHAKLKLDLEMAYKDLEALYMIEKYHVTSTEPLSKVAARKFVETNENMTLSGKHTPSQVKRRLALLEHTYLQSHHLSLFERHFCLLHTLSLYVYLAYQRVGIFFSAAS